jgi:hypothetical protein
LVDVDFYAVEKEYLRLLGKLYTTNENQFDYEMQAYLVYYNNNKDYFVKIASIIESKLHSLKNFSKEGVLVNNFIKICEDIILFTKLPIDKFFFGSQILTNLLFLSFSSKILEEIECKNDYLYHLNFTLIENFAVNINNFFLFYDVSFIETSQNTQAFKNLAFFLFQVLIENQLIAFNRGVSASKSKKKLKVKTPVYYGLKVKYNSVFLFNFKVFLNEPEILIKNQLYFIGVHFNSIEKIFKKNIKSDKTFHLNELQFLNKIKKLKYVVD